MHWKKEFELLEASSQWNGIIDLLKRTMQDYPDKPEPAIRLIYFLHDLLVEQDYSSRGFNHDTLAKMLKELFENSTKKFNNNSEYLFFLGKIMHIAEWYFGLNNNDFAFELQKRAMELEPQNKLYRWAYCYSTNKDKEAYSLAKLVLNDDKVALWLDSKGFPGKYVLRSIKSCVKNNNEKG